MIHHAKQAEETLKSAGGVWRLLQYDLLALFEAAGNFRVDPI
jgi:hypothetical protein